MLPRQIKLIGADLDGTLLNDDKQLCAGAADTIRKAVHSGIHFVPITGRPLSGIPECIRNFKEIEYLICSNGAQIIRNETGESLFSFAIPNDTCRQLIGIFRSLGCMFEPFADGVGYCEEHIFEYYKATYADTVIADYIFSSRKVVPAIEPLFADGTREADEFFINCTAPEIRTALERILDKMPALQYCNLGDRFMEITKKGTDKGEALAKICALLGVDLQNTVAFGDGENDLLFLEKAGIAVAMENAFPSVKEKADMVAESNNHNGVCKIIERLIEPDAFYGKQS